MIRHHLDVEQLPAGLAEQLRHWLLETKLNVPAVRDAQDLLTGKSMDRFLRAEEDAVAEKLAQAKLAADLRSDGDRLLWDEEKQYLELADSRWRATSPGGSNLMEISRFLTRSHAVQFAAPMRCDPFSPSTTFQHRYRWRSFSPQFLSSAVYVRDMFWDFSGSSLKVDRKPKAALAPRCFKIRLFSVGEEAISIKGPALNLVGFHSQVAGSLSRLGPLDKEAKYQYRFYRGKCLRYQPYKSQNPVATVQTTLRRHKSPKLGTVLATPQHPDRIHFLEALPVERLAVLMVNAFYPLAFIYSRNLEGRPSFPIP